MSIDRIVILKSVTMICVGLGLSIGFVGFGCGLIFLTTKQSFGLGIVASALSVILIFVFAGKRIAKEIIEMHETN